MKNVYGENFRIEIFGASHAPEIGVVIEGVPAGTEIDMDRLQAFMDRRAPGRDEFSTPRKEPDCPDFVSGVSNGVADGTVIKAVIRNTNVRSGDYETSVPRPGHADYPASVKFGESYSFAGGGPFSGRMTAPLCIAGAIAIQLLERRGVKVSAKPVRIGGATDEAEMKAFGNASIARHKVPKYFLFVNEFPMNAAGKILKYKMRDESAERLGLKK
jgi:chorismate synthase